MPLTLEETFEKLGKSSDEIISIVSRFHDDFTKITKKSKSEKPTLGSAALKPISDTITKSSKATDKLLKKSFDTLTNTSFNNAENIISAIESINAGAKKTNDQTLGQQKFAAEVSAIPNALEGVADQLDDSMDALLGQIAGSNFVAEGVEIPEFDVDEPGQRQDDTAMQSVMSDSFDGLTSNVNNVSDDIRALIESGIMNAQNIVNAIFNSGGVSRAVSVDTSDAVAAEEELAEARDDSTQSANIFSKAFGAVTGVFDSVIDVLDDFFPVIGELRGLFGRIAGAFKGTFISIATFPFKLFKKIFTLSFIPFTAIWGLLRKSKDFNRSLNLITKSIGTTFGFLGKTIKAGFKGIGTLISSSFNKHVAGSRVSKIVTKGFSGLGKFIGKGFSLMAKVAVGIFSVAMAALPFLIIAAIIGVIFLIYKNWDTVKSAFDEYVVQPFVNLLGGVWDSIKGFFSELMSDAREFVSNTLGETVAGALFGEKDTATMSSEEKEAKKATPQDQSAVIKESVRLEKTKETTGESQAELEGINKNLDKLNKTMETKKEGDTIINQPPSSNIEDLSTYMVTQ